MLAVIQSDALENYYLSLTNETRNKFFCINIYHSIRFRRKQMSGNSAPMKNYFPECGKFAISETQYCNYIYW